MLDRMKRFTRFALVFSLLCVPALAGSDYYTGDDYIELSQLPEDITLVEALKQYPQLQEIYPVRIISAEEGAELIAQGVKVAKDPDGNVIYGDYILAVPYLAQFSAVKKPPVSQSEIASLETRGAVSHAASSCG